MKFIKIPFYYTRDAMLAIAT